MGVNLQVLAMQSVPRLAKRLGAKVSFPERALSVPLAPDEFRRLLDECGRIVDSFFEQFKISWWDVYVNSDIGLERMAIAQEMQLHDHDVVLDIGCGRGYFSVAAAKSSQVVVGVDLMDGVERPGWWRNFNTCMNELNLCERVSAIKSDAEHLPVRSSSFTVVAAVHSIRNFPNYLSIETALREMKRVAAKGGRVIIVENLPVARTKAQESHLLMFKCKVKCTSGELNYPSEVRIAKMFKKTGFRRIKIKTLSYNWSATPPLFCIDNHLTSLPESEREKAKEEYNEAADMIRKWGEVSPPALFAEGTK
jgi:ubiquinone/menaquinone biosynthesis C-methylase UbiE